MITALLLAQGAGTIAGWAKWVIIVCVVLAILFAFIQYSGVQIPAIAVKVFWIVVIGIICLVGINLIMQFM